MAPGAVKDLTHQFSRSTYLDHEASYRPGPHSCNRTVPLRCDEVRDRFLEVRNRYTAAELA